MHGFNPTAPADNFGVLKGLRSDALERSTEIEPLRLNPSPPRTQRFRRDPANAELIISESAALRKGGDACVKKTAGLRRGVCEPFSSACVVASIARVPIPKSSLLSQRLISLWLSLFIFLWHQRKKRAVKSTRNKKKYLNVLRMTQSQLG
jgi:hypothetical protein